MVDKILTDISVLSGVTGSSETPEKVFKERKIV